MKTAIRIIAAVLAASLALVSCAKQEAIDNGSANPADGARTIAVSFANASVKSELEGLQPKFVAGDVIKVSNGTATEDCTVSIDGSGNASISTSLTGALTMVYPAAAAKMNGNAIEGVLVPTVQDGTFASANICKATIAAGATSASFENQTAVFCITPGAGASTKYVEVITAGPEIASSVPTSSTFTKLNKIHVESASAAPVYVSILVPSGLKVRDLSFADGSNMKTLKDDTDAIAANSLYTVTNENWNRPYAEIGGLKWAKQNLSITESGNKSWKGDNTSAVKVPGTDEDVKVGDYFQWAAYAGYCGNATDADNGLLIYTAFNNKCCGDAEYKFTFKSAGGENTYKFQTSTSGTSVGISPYWNGSAYTEYMSGEVNLAISDDVANIILGGAWRMPAGRSTGGEFRALFDATYWAWDATDKGIYVYAPNPATDAGRYNSGTGSYDKSNALLFFPAAGRGVNSDFCVVGSDGNYWSGALDSSNSSYAYRLSFYDSGVAPQIYNSRYYGLSVRSLSD